MTSPSIAQMGRGASHAMCQGALGPSRRRAGRRHHYRRHHRHHLLAVSAIASREDVGRAAVLVASLFGSVFR